MSIRVCIPHTRRDYFDYEAIGLIPLVGARVLVPFRQTMRIGLVIAVDEMAQSGVTLKPIQQILDHQPLLPFELIALCQWVSRYYQSPLSEVLPLALPKRYQRGQHAQKQHQPLYQLTMSFDEARQQLPARAYRQLQLLTLIANSESPISPTMIRQAGFTLTHLKPLLNLNVVRVVESVSKVTPANRALVAPPVLTLEQMQAVQTIGSHLQAYQCFLLQGVTGSGKTEVYLQVVSQVLALERQVLVLVPEIGLTPQLLARFNARFHEPMVVIHSHLNELERQMAWHRASIGEARLVLGTRSAIFTPLPQLGLIVVDEEHDASFKQMEGVRYSARDTALMRAHAANVPIILGSATPNLETLHNVALNKYQPLHLTQRALSATPLQYRILDIRQQPLQQGLAPTSLALIQDHLSQGNQILVFINRRGFSPVLLCHQCGWIADCRACDSHLTVHRAAGRLICHHCGLNQKMLQCCQQCQQTELLPIGAGTQRIHEFLQAQFPQATLLRIDRDEVRNKQTMDARLAQMHAGEAQLLIGTQMLAKGHDLPRLTLVVVVDADQGFYNQDFRALERLGQLLIQVAGRAGRAHLPGQVVIQTHLPQHPLLNILIQAGYPAFADALLAHRLQAQLPPFAFLAMLRAQAKQMPKVLALLHACKDHLATSDLQILGPAPAPLARKAGYHRFQLLFKASSRRQLQATLTPLREWITMNKLSMGVRWNIDVDPLDLS